MTRFDLLASALLLSSGTAATQDNIMGPNPGAQETAGPAVVCATAVALRLAQGERVRRQEGHDFTLLYVQAADGPFLIYEGSYPQPHDDEIATGLPFPSVIAIHDNRTAEAKARTRVRDRLLTGAAFAAACPARPAAR